MNPFDPKSLDNLLKTEPSSIKTVVKGDSQSNDISQTTSDGIFSKVKLDNRVLLGRRGTPINRSLIKLSISNNIAVIGTSDGVVLRFSVDGTGDIEEIEVSRRSEDTIEKIFLDPTGGHCIVSLKNNDVFYINNKSLRAKKLSKFQGSLVCVAFDRFTNTSQSIPSSQAESSLKPFLVGTSTGKIYEVLFDSNGREKYNQLVYQVDTQVSITSLSFINLSTENNTEYQTFVFFATSNPIRLFHFLGGPTIQKLFSDSLISGQSNCTELPGDKLQRAEIQYNGRSLEKNISFAILTKMGIYQGSIHFNDLSISSENLTVVAQLVPFPSNSPLPSLSDPLDVISTSYHFLSLRKDRIHVISRLSADIVQELHVTKEIEGFPSAIVKDLQKDAIWFLTDLGLYKIFIQNEDRFVWSIYLNKALNGDEKCFELALQHAKTKDQRAEIIRVQAQSYLNQEQYEKAALNFAKVDISFDEAILSLLQCHSFGVTNLLNNSNKNLNDKMIKSLERKGLIALRIYLSEIIKRLNPLSKSQITMVSTWLCEIILNHIAEINLQVERPSENQVHTKADLIQVFKELLRSQKSLLDSSTIFNLITSRNDRVLYLFYSQIIGDYDRVIGYYFNDSRYMDVVNVLTDAPFEKVESMIYKFAPVLIEFEPEATIDMLLSKPRVRIAKLLPTILRYCTVLDQQSQMTELPADVNHVGFDFNGRKVNYAIKYLQEHIALCELDQSHGILESSAYHTLIWLLSKYDETDEKETIKFLESIMHKLKDGLLTVSLDREYILRECRRHNRVRSVALAFLLLEMEEEAIKTVISFDMELAQSFARECTDHSKKKKLWMIIAKYFIETENDIKKTTAILNESNGILQIEDLLPYLPDFAEIDVFKDEICKSLEQSGAKIDNLKHEMAELSESAENITQELEGMKKRGDCLSKRVSKFLDSSQVANLKNIEDQLKQLTLRGKDTDKKTATLQEYLQKEIDGYIAADCPLCGFQMIQALVTPLITEEDEAEAKSWTI